MVAWPTPGLAERGQHRADVVEERAVRADDEHARPVELVAERVEQPGGAVQADRRLAGAGRSLHADAGADVAAHDLVLLGLDRRDDVAHRADAGPLDLRREDAAGCGRVAGGEVLVLVGGEAAAVDAEAAPQLHAHRLGGGGPVERRGDRGPPVDDHRVAVVVADVPAPDVERLLAVLGAHVDPAEEQGGARVVLQRGDPAGEHLPEQLAGPGVGGLLRLEPVGGLPHPTQVVAGVVEVGLLAGEHVVGGDRGLGGGGVRRCWGSGVGGRRGHGGSASLVRVGSHTGEPMMVAPGWGPAEVGSGRCVRP